MNRLKLVIPLLFLGLLAGCGTLNTSGPYQGNKVLYDADTVIITSYDAIHTFVAWEFQNRAALASIPSIKIKADELRRQAPGAFKAALMLRDTYAQNPGSGTEASLRQALAILRQMASIAMTYVSQYATGTVALESPLVPPTP